MDDFHRAAARASELRANGDFEAAAGHYEVALSHLGSGYGEARADIYSDLGLTLNQMGRRQEAFAAYRSSIALNPVHVNAYNNLAVAQQAHGDVDAALMAYAVAVKLRPEMPVLRLNAFRMQLEGARWRSWPLLGWLAHREVSANATWPWARLEARAFLVDSAARLHAAARG